MWTNEKRDGQMYQLHQDGNTYKYIAKSFGISQSRCQQACNHYVRIMKERESIAKIREEIEKDRRESILTNETIKLVVSNEQFQRIIPHFSPSEISDMVFGKNTSDSNTLTRTLISDDFSVRALNCFRLNKINTYGDLIKHTYSDLMHYKNMGRKAMLEIEERLKELGLKLREQQ